MLNRGQLPRREASRVVGAAERTTRELVSRLVESELVGSETPKGPLRLRFTTSSADALFPRSFPAQA